MKKMISILIPCYNERENIEAMACAITEQMIQLKQYDYEIIFRDNASTDGSLEVLRKVAANDKRIKIIVNSRNYGPLGAKRSYINNVHGEVAICLACDFQDPPELIPEFVKWWEEGYQVVCGQKIGSKEGFIKYKCRSLYYSIISMFSDIPHKKHISGMTLVNTKIFQSYLVTDLETNFREFIADSGYTIKIVPYEQQKRKSGKSSYNIARYFSFAISSLIATSTLPLRVATVLGVLFSLISFLIGLIYFIQKMIWWDKFSLGLAPILIGMFFIGSVQLFFIGLIGEYVGVILKKVTKPIPLTIKETINFDEFCESEYTTVMNNVSEKSDSSKKENI